MAATSTQGTGNGSAANLYPKITNDVVKQINLRNAARIFENLNNQIVISTADGTVDSIDAAGITIQTGAGYPDANNGVEGPDADGGEINIIAGQANGSGEGGDININAGNCGDGIDANGGNVYIRGGDAGTANNSDGGNIELLGGDGSDGIGDSDGGSINIQAGNAGDDGQAGMITISAGNSGTGDNSTENDPEAGDIQINAGSSFANTSVDGGEILINAGQATLNGSGGDITISAGNSVGTDQAGDIILNGGLNSGAGSIYLNSMAIMPIYANATARNAAAGTATNGMFCYNTDTGNIEVYVGGSWKTVTAGS